MSIQTPEQIARAALPVYIGDSDTSDGFSQDDLLTFAAAAIYAERAQRISAEFAWRDGYFTGKRDYAASLMGGLPISTPNPYGGVS